MTGLFPFSQVSQYVNSEGWSLQCTKGLLWLKGKAKYVSSLKN